MKKPDDKIHLYDTNLIYEVFLAHDTKLKRDVALKILPEAVRDDPERLRRFRTEAEAAAKLNHPNIATIFSIEEADNPDGAPQTFITMEHVNGKTLSEHIPSDGLEVDQFFEWFIRLTDALAHAHEHGRIHRDLKPGNIMIREDGVPIILDFGLATIEREGQDTEDAEAPTMTMGASETQGNSFLGTPAYMSPEQIEGKKVDARTDLFSLGVVMYEAIAGQRSFKGDTLASITGRILTEDPDAVSDLRPMTPHQLWWTIKKTLHKVRDWRTQTAMELHSELQEVLRELQAGTMLVDAKSISSLEPPVSEALPLLRQPSAMSTIAATLLIGLGAAWYLKPVTPESEPPLRKFQWPIDGVDQSVISPDGTRLAYVAGNRRWIQDLDSVNPRAVSEEADAVLPFWSPDGDFLGYQTGSPQTVTSLWKVPAQGGQRILISTTRPGSRIQSAAWGRSESILFAVGQGGPFTDSNLYSISIQDGETRVFLPPDSSEVWLDTPYFLPDGRTSLFLIAQRGDSTTVNQIASRYPDPADARFIDYIMRSGISRLDIGVYSNDLGRRILKLPGDFNERPVYAPSGHLLYRNQLPSRRATLWAVAFDLESLTVTGEPFIVTSGSEGASVSGDGTLMYQSTPSGSGQQLVWVDRTGRIIDIIGSSPLDSRYFWSPSLSPDGTRVAVSSSDIGSGGFLGNITWIYDHERGTRTRPLNNQLTFQVQTVWSRSGMEIAVTGGDLSLANGTGADFYRMNADGTGEPTPILIKPLNQFGLNWSRTHSVGIYHEIEGNQRDLWSVSIPDLVTTDPLPESVRFMRTPDNEARPFLSPDGRYVAYQSQPAGSDLSEGWEVYIQRFPEGGEHTRVSTAGGVHPKWSADGDELFFVQPEGNMLMVASVRTQPNLAVDTPQMVFPGDQIGARLFKPVQPQGTPYEYMYDVSSDAQRFVVVQDERETETITVVQNWYAEFKDRE